MKNLGTTIAGIGGALGVLGFALKAYFDGDPSTNPDYGAIVLAVTTLIGLFKAADAKKETPAVELPQGADGK
jgi:hypothetical protein